METKPTVGRMVHYTPPQDCKGKTTLEFYAAIIVQVNADGSCELATFGPNSLYFQHGVQQAEKHTPGRWSWPPRA